MKRIGLTLLILLVLILVCGICLGIIILLNRIFGDPGFSVAMTLILLWLTFCIYKATGDFYKQKEEDEKSRNEDD